MTALSSHLRPAPYPYGLLTLRLLGKLGGKNRCFLREPLDVSFAIPLNHDSLVLSIPCDWSSDEATDTPEHDGKSEKMIIDSSEIDSDKKRADATDAEHRVVLPLERAVEVLQLVALSSGKGEALKKEETTAGDDSDQIKLRWEEYHKLGSLVADRIDISEYCANVVEETKQDQAKAALKVVRSALAMVIELQNGHEDICLDRALSVSEELASKGELPNPVDFESDTGSLRKTSNGRTVRTEKFKIICKGLMFASAIDPIREEAAALVKGVASHVFLLLMCLRPHISRIDAFGSPIPGSSGDATTAKMEKEDSEEAVESQDEGVQTARSDSNPLGCFLLTGPFIGKADPFVLNEAIAEVLVESSPRTQCVVLDLIRSLLQTSQGPSGEKATSNEATEASMPPVLCPSDYDMFFESLIAALCRACLSSPWNSRSGLYEAIFLIMDGLGPKWGSRFEVEVIHVALLGLKTAPKDIPVAAIKAFQFFSRACATLYSSPTPATGTEGPLIRDPIMVVDREEMETGSDGRRSSSGCTSPSQAVVQMLVGELASVKHILR
jgi:transformation/transcription domain-associated protein